MTELSQIAARNSNEILVRVLEEQRNRLIRKDFGRWCAYALKPFGQAPARHHRLLIEKLALVSSGKIDRLMLLLPPGSAKSTYASVLFPAWWFANHPRSTVIAASP